MTTVYFNVFPSSETQSGGNAPANTRTTSTTVGSAAYNAWLGNGSYDGWTVFTGPFSTAAEAEADLKSSHPGPGSILGVVSGIALGAGNESPSAALNTGQTAQNAANAALSWEQALGKFFGALTQANTWIRVAKVVFGGTLLVIGIAHITGASNTVANAARKVPVPI